MSDRLGRIVRRSYRRAGRLIPKHPHGLRARSVLLKPKAVMAWHSTGSREELLIGLSGCARLEIRAGGARHTMALSPGRTIWLPAAVRHRVVNSTSRAVHYLYVTGAAG